MERDIYQHLLTWKNANWRKPLILQGARQVGKTYILKEIASREYKNFAYLNFEEDPALDNIFSSKIDISKILNYISIYTHQPLSPHETLIIFDEIQMSPNALNSLKYFNEYANEFHLACAGSFLGVMLSTIKSFPVGKVNFLNLYPLSFFEFLNALNKKELRTLIEKNKSDFASVPEIFHQDLTGLLKYYYIIGGMPEVVAAYVQGNTFDFIRKIQREIITAYLLDIVKHTGKAEIIKINQIWDSIPLYLSRENKKFVFSALRHSARAREYETSLQWLLDAGLIYKSMNVTHPGFPLNSYKEKGFKIFMFDIGILGAMANISPEILIYGSEIFTHFHGALVENYVAQQLKPLFDNLFYWTSSGNAEVDFLIETNNQIYALEAKAGINLKSKSLKAFGDKFPNHVISRTSLNNFMKKGRIVNYPLYAIELFPILYLSNGYISG
jgi:predicted AAA+ superfamily ATPase